MDYKKAWEELRGFVGDLDESTFAFICHRADLDIEIIWAMEKLSRYISEQMTRLEQDGGRGDV